MKTLHEKIEGLTKLSPDNIQSAGYYRPGDPAFYDSADVLCIATEHKADAALLKIAALFNGWANAGPPDGGPANVTTAAGVLTKIGAALGVPFGEEEEQEEKVGPVGQAGCEHASLADFRAANHEGGQYGQLCLLPVQIPVELIHMHGTWESATGLLVHAIYLCDDRYAMRYFRPWNKSWSEVEAMARAAESKQSL